MSDTEVTARSVSVYNATPTVKVDSQSNVTVNAQLLSMEMRESEGGLTSMELRFNNFGTFASGQAQLIFEDDEVLKLGAVVEVAAGDQTAPMILFKGKISALECCFRSDGRPELCVLAEDALQAARMKRRTKVYENVTLEDLVARVAETCGLTPASEGLQTNVGTQVQLNESDLAFVRRILARYDADLQVVGNELHAAKRDQIQRNRVDISVNEKLRQARVCADLAHQVTKVEYSGWNFADGVVAAASREDRFPGPGAGLGGAAILKDAFGDRAEQVAHLMVRNRVEAQAVVDADWEQRSRKFVTMRATTEGTPSLRVGSHVRMTGLGGRFSNTYYVVATTHRFDQVRGYQTDFTAECAYLGAGG